MGRQLVADALITGAAEVATPGAPPRTHWRRWGFPLVAAGLLTVLGALGWWFLSSQPADGEEESEVLAEPVGGVASAHPRSGVYLAKSQPLTRGQRWAIQFLDVDSGQLTEVFRKDGPFYHGRPDVSADEEWILYSESPAPTSELMLVENLR